MKTFHYIYHITNQNNGKYYIGKRSFIGGSLEDDSNYLGSGTLIKRAVRKHGKGAFTKKVLSTHRTLRALNREEQRVVTLEIISDPKCYNIALGGNGGNLGPAVQARLNRIVKSRRYRQRMSEIINEPAKKKQIADSIRRTMSDPEWKRKFSETQKRVQNAVSNRERNKAAQLKAQRDPGVVLKKRLIMLDKYRDPVFRSKHRTAVNSMQFRIKQKEFHTGTVWVHKGNKKKYIKNNLIHGFLSDGWSLGMGKRNKKC